MKAMGEINHEEYFKGYATDFEHYTNQHKGLAKARFVIKLKRGVHRANRLLRKTLKKKECYYGPFKGEFGHFLGHNLPFLNYLYSQGVRIHYCGMELHKPFLIDENGNSLVESFFPLRDFFGEVKPRSNSAVPPEDVCRRIEEFDKKARSSSIPFWDINDDFFYWYVYRNWLSKNKYSVVPSLDRAYAKDPSQSAVIFARKKGHDFTPNNGGPWNYMELARSIAPYFDRVYITGHPAMSDSTVHSEGNIRIALSTDNTKILEFCSNSELIISQHSGVSYLGEFTNCQVLVIFNGPPPIKGIPDTLRFKEYLGEKYPLEFAFSEEEVVSFVEDFVKRRK